MNIAIVCGYYYPQNTPRAFRASELAEELARRGYHVNVFTLTGGNDYSNYTKQTNVIVHNIGNSTMGMSDTYGKTKCNWLTRVFVRLFSRLLFLPYMELVWMIRKRIGDITKDTDILISIAHPYSTHWGIALSKKKEKRFPLWISDCGDPFMGDPANRPGPHRRNG